MRRPWPLVGILLLAATACDGAGTAASSTSTPGVVPDSWTAKASMLREREGGGAGLGGAGSQLLDGRVLVVGGFDATAGRLSFDTANYLSEAEIYDPAGDRWDAAPPMHDARLGPAVTTLTDGKVLVAGGFAGQTVGAVQSVEIYDPVKRSWTIGPQLSTCRGQPGVVDLTGPPHAGQAPARTATDRVLVIGGVGCQPDQQSEATAEIFDAAKQRWTAVAPMHQARWGQSTTLLKDGRVLVAGGYPGGAQVGRGDVLSSAEIYDAKANTWTETGSMTVPRIFQAAGLLPNGQVIVAGGRTCSSRTCATQRAETFDPKTGVWTEAPPMSVPRAQGSAVVLGDKYGALNGAFIVVGGAQQQTSEIYDPKVADWLAPVPLATMHDNAFVVQLYHGYVLAMGGFTEKPPAYSDTASVEQLGTERVGK